MSSLYLRIENDCRSLWEFMNYCLSEKETSKKLIENLLRKISFKFGNAFFSSMMNDSSKQSTVIYRVNWIWNELAVVKLRMNSELNLKNIVECANSFEKFYRPSQTHYNRYEHFYFSTKQMHVILARYMGDSLRVQILESIQHVWKNISGFKHFLINATTGMVLLLCNLMQCKLYVSDNEMRNFGFDKQSLVCVLDEEIYHHGNTEKSCAKKQLDTFDAYTTFVQEQLKVELERSGNTQSMLYNWSYRMMLEWRNELCLAVTGNTDVLFGVKSNKRMRICNMQFYEREVRNERWKRCNYCNSIATRICCLW